MNTRFLLLLLIACVVNPAPAQQAAAPAETAAKRVLDLNSTLLELLADPRTRAVIDKRLPNLAERTLGDEEVARMFGNSTLRELAVDPHVRGLTEEVLKKIEAELKEAQK